MVYSLFLDILTFDKICLFLDISILFILLIMENNYVDTKIKNREGKKIGKLGCR